jgi:hypothetical protein
MVETGTTAVTKRVKLAKGGSYCVYVPYQWNGKNVLISFMDEDYRFIAKPENGRVTVKVSEYKQIHPAGELGRRNTKGDFVGKRVQAFLVENFDEVEKELTEGKEFLEAVKIEA